MRWNRVKCPFVVGRKWKREMCPRAASNKWHKNQRAIFNKEIWKWLVDKGWFE